MKILHKANLLLLILFTSSFAYADFDWKGLFTGKGFGLSLADMFGNLIAFNIFGYSFIKWMAILTGTFLIILAAHKYIRSGDGKEGRVFMHWSPVSVWSPCRHLLKSFQPR